MTNFLVILYRFHFHISKVSCLPIVTRKQKKIIDLYKNKQKGYYFTSTMDTIFKQVRKKENKLRFLFWGHKWNNYHSFP